MGVELDGLRTPTWPVAVIILGLLAVILSLKKRSLSYLVCFVIFAIYLLFAIDKAFFPIAISGDYVDSMRQVPFLPFINLIPLNFNFNLSEMPELVLQQIFQNILLTIPFGFGLSFVAPVKANDFRWLIPVVGIGIEAMQFLISLVLRYPYRVIDINDAILNTLGVLIGYLIFRVFAWFCLWLIQRTGIQHRGHITYIYDIASRK